MYSFHLKLNHMMGNITSRYKLNITGTIFMVKGHQLHFGNISKSKTSFYEITNFSLGNNLTIKLQLHCHD